MGRLIVLALLIVAAVWLLRRALRRGEQRPENPSLPDDLVRCARCGLHLPRANALSREGHDYCSEEHRRLGAVNGDRDA